MNHLPSRWFTWNVKSYFLWKKMRMCSATNLLGALKVYLKLKGNGCTHRESNSLKIAFVPFWKGSNQNRKNVSPHNNCKGLSAIITKFQTGNHERNWRKIIQEIAQLQTLQRIINSSAADEQISCTWLKINMHVSNNKDEILQKYYKAQSPRDKKDLKLTLYETIF